MLYAIDGEVWRGDIGFSRERQRERNRAWEERVRGAGVKLLVLLAYTAVQRLVVSGGLFIGWELVFCQLIDHKLLEITI